MSHPVRHGLVIRCSLICFTVIHLDNSTSLCVALFKITGNDSFWHFGKRQTVSLIYPQVIPPMLLTVRNRKGQVRTPIEGIGNRYRPRCYLLGRVRWCCSLHSVTICPCFILNSPLEDYGRQAFVSLFLSCNIHLITYNRNDCLRFKRLNCFLTFLC